MTAVTERPPVLSIRGLKTWFAGRDGLVKAVDGVDVDVHAGKTLCVVGESGSGKSMLARSVLQIVSPPGHIVDGRILLRRDGRPEVDIAALDPNSAEMRAIRGRDIAMIFRTDELAVADPHRRQPARRKDLLHHKVDTRGRRARRARARPRRHPRAAHSAEELSLELSGGMRQRVMIAMALGCQAVVLIADEPTTALDVTTQANILELIPDLQAELGMAVMFITHDLGVVAEIADEVAVVYLGRVVERGSVEDIFYDPQHPYTLALLGSIPKLGARRGRGQRLTAIEGMVPHPLNRPQGCPFNTRCPEAVPGLCDVEDPASGELGPGHFAACHLRDPSRIPLARGAGG